MDKIAIVNQRYGAEVNGGSEHYTMQIAKQLSKEYNVEIITTTALSHINWENYYQPGIKYTDGITIRRFQVKKKRNVWILRILNRLFKVCPVFSGIFGEIWIKAQGPFAPEAITYLEENVNQYKAILFVTYLYYLTAIGLPKVAEKAILIPTAHDEIPIYYKIYNKVFKSPKAILYLTEEEKKFTENLFQIQNKINEIVGTGIEIPKFEKSDSILKEYGIDTRFVVYIGRVDKAKGCNILIKNFIEYQRKYNKVLKLILIGKVSLEIPKHQDIITLGFVNEDIKYSILSKAKLLILPSQYESLSLSVLESMALGVPVLVNGKSEVLKAHCIKSKAGLYYTNEIEFEKQLSRILDEDILYNELKENTKIYVRKNYNWENTILKYKKIIEKI